MKHTFFAATIVATGILLSSCDEKNEDITQDINKNGSIESAITIEHADSLHDVLITKHNVWTNGAISKSIVYRDTVLALGQMTTDAENKEGETQKVAVKKDYEIFITVK